MWKVTNERGQSLVFALIIISVLMISLVSVLLFTRTDLQQSQKQTNRNNAYYIAEAGLQRAIHEVDTSLLNEQAPGTFFSDPNFNGGSYEVTVTPKTNASGENIGYTLLSTGTYRNERKTLSAWIRQPLGYSLLPLNYAIYAKGNASIHTLSALLNLHNIRVNGNVHTNGTVAMTNTGLLSSNPVINGMVSSTSLSNIQVQGLPSGKKTVRSFMPMPEFDFDSAREVAKREGVYVNDNVSSLSLLGIGPSSKVIFVDGNLSLTGVDLLGISLLNRTIIVNGNFSGALSVGGATLVNTNLNIIAKENIEFLGAVTGLQVNGIIFAQGYNRSTNLPDPNTGNISVAGHLEVNGYLGGNNISVGGGLLSGLLGLVTGDMQFTYNDSAFSNLPKGIGFKTRHVEIVEQKVVPQ
jgi:hypothetical protein